MLEIFHMLEGYAFSALGGNNCQCFPLPVYFSTNPKGGHNCFSIQPTICHCGLCSLKVRHGLRCEGEPEVVCTPI